MQGIDNNQIVIIFSAAQWLFIRKKTVASYLRTLPIRDIFCFTNFESCNQSMKIFFAYRYIILLTCKTFPCAKKHVGPGFSLYSKTRHKTPEYSNCPGYMKEYKIGFTRMRSRETVWVWLGKSSLS